MVVFGHDPTPMLSMDDGVARALAATADRRPSKEVNTLLQPQCSGGCQSLTRAVHPTWRRALLAQVDVNGTVGPGVLRGTFHIAPALTDAVSRTVHVISRDGRLQSVSAWSAGVSVAFESAYMEVVQGFIEVGYEAIGGIPDGARIARMEPADLVISGVRLVHRPTASVRMQGDLLDDITWRFRATVAPMQRELALAPRLGYRLSLSQDVGMGMDLFAGVPGSKGYFLLPMSRFYADWAYRF